jgi:hypothetical protein
MHITPDVHVAMSGILVSINKPFRCTLIHSNVLAFDHFELDYIVWIGSHRNKGVDDS